MTLKQVIRHYGSLWKAHQALGVSHQAVYLWRKWGFVPHGSQLKIEEQTGGKLKADK